MWESLYKYISIRYTIKIKNKNTEKDRKIDRERENY